MRCEKDGFWPILIRLGMRLSTAENRKWKGKENTLIDCLCYYNWLDRLRALYICSIKPPAHSAM